MFNIIIAYHLAQFLCTMRAFLNIGSFCYLFWKITNVCFLCTSDANKGNKNDGSEKHKKASSQEVEVKEEEKV